VKSTLLPDAEAIPSAERLETVVLEKFREMDEIISLKRSGRDADALAVFRTNRGKALMDEANVFFSGLITAADDRLTEGVAEQRANAAWFRWFTIVSGVTIVAVVGGAAIAVVRYTRELAAARDQVTELASGLEERVRERTADLAQANEEVQRFAYIVTHDLRAPLVNIMGFTSELESGVKSMQELIDQPGVGAANDPVAQEARTAATEDLPEAISFIRSSTKKMDNLINSVLTLSREGRRTIRPERIDLRAAFEASAAVMQHQLSEAGGKINVAIDAPPLVSDRLALEQIVGNILDNAVKYRSDSRTLRVDLRATAQPGDRIGIEIADNGRGIAAQDLERVFELFRRSGPQDKPGEGIGLAYVRTLVRRLGGEISVASVLDEGTTFRILLPRALQAAEVSVQ
jgi:signal transduction histidine kinase